MKFEEGKGKTQNPKREGRWGLGEGQDEVQGGEGENPKCKARKEGKGKMKFKKGKGKTQNAKRERRVGRRGKEKCSSRWERGRPKMQSEKGVGRRSWGKMKFKEGKCTCPPPFCQMKPWLKFSEIRVLKKTASICSQ